MFDKRLIRLEDDRIKSLQRAQAATDESVRREYLARALEYKYQINTIIAERAS